MSSAPRTNLPEPRGAVAQGWTRFSLTVPRESIDALSYLLIELGSPGVVAGERDLRRTRSAATSRRRRARVDGFFPATTPLPRLRATLRKALAPVATEFPGIDLGAATLTRLGDDELGSTWQEHFPPVKLGRRFLVAPPWESSHANGRVTLRIEPARAFGTGHHATTRSCVAALEDVCTPARRRRGLDVGSGTGILSLVMRALGVREVVAIDNDPLARQATEEAARANRLARVHVRDQLGRARGRFDLIAANLFAGLLVELAPALAARLEPKGALVVSGLLARQEAEVRTALGRSGLEVTARRVLRGWVTLTAEPGGRRRRTTMR